MNDMKGGKSDFPPFFLRMDFEPRQTVGFLGIDFAEEKGSNQNLCAMKKTVLFCVAFLLSVISVSTTVTVIGQKKILSPKKERREAREKRRAERIVSFEHYIDSLVLSRNFEFNPQTMQRQPAGPMRQIMNPAFNVDIWNGSADICLPYVKGYVPPYYVTVINYTIPELSGYTTEQTHEYNRANEMQLWSKRNATLFRHIQQQERRSNTILSVLSAVLSTSKENTIHCSYAQKHTKTMRCNSKSYYPILYNQKTVICNACPMTPPMSVAAISNQSNLPPCILSLNSIPTARPATKRIVNRKAAGMA